MPPGTLEELLKPENKEKLVGILTYHVVPGTVMAADVKEGEVKTLNGEPFNVSMDGGKVKVNEADVVKTDIVASNGVIHVINKVITP